MKRFGIQLKNEETLQDIETKLNEFKIDDKDELKFGQSQLLLTLK